MSLRTRTNKQTIKKNYMQQHSSEILVYHSVKAVTSGHAHDFKTLLADARAAESITIEVRVCVRKQASTTSKQDATSVWVGGWGKWVNSQSSHA